MLTLDSSALLALADRRERHHAAAVRALASEDPPHVVPAGILAEVCYLLERRGGVKALDAFLRDLETGAYVLDCGDQDLPRIRALVAKFEDLSLGFSDAAVIACAERSGGKVFTFDRRDFDVVARAGTIALVP